MTFRLEEAFKRRYDDFVRSEVLSLPADRRAEGHDTVQRIIDIAGRPTGPHPSWHPLSYELDVALGHDRGGWMNHQNLQEAPNGGRLLDHVWFFEEGILTMPYNAKASQELTGVLNRLSEKSPGVRNLDVSPVEGCLHSPACALVLVTHRCWSLGDNTRSSDSAKLSYVLRYLERTSRDGCYSESWENLREDLLGGEAGARSSQHVSPDLGKRIKLIHDGINAAEYPGPTNHNRYSGPTYLAPPYIKCVSRWYPETAQHEAKAEEEYKKLVAEAKTKHREYVAAEAAERKAAEKALRDYQNQQKDEK